MISSAIAVNIKDHIPEYTAEVKKQIELGLRTIGARAVSNAGMLCPRDTGRLRNSIAWATTKATGGANGFDGEKSSSSDHAKRGTPHDLTLVIGTNVEYAPYVEFGSSSHQVGQAHFLRDGIAKHGDQYKNLLIAALNALK